MDTIQSPAKTAPVNDDIVVIDFRQKGEQLDGIIKEINGLLKSIKKVKKAKNVVDFRTAAFRASLLIEKMEFDGKAISAKLKKLAKED